MHSEVDLRFALETEHPALLFGHALDPTELKTTIERICGEVAFCDLRSEVPADLEARFLRGLTGGRTLYVSVGHTLPARVRDLLLSVTERGELPGHAGRQLSRRLVLSANVRKLRDLGEDLRDCFPVCVGV